MGKNSLSVIFDPFYCVNCDVRCNVTNLEHHQYAVDCKYLPFVLTENTRECDMDFRIIFRILEF